MAILSKSTGATLALLVGLVLSAGAAAAGGEIHARAACRARSANATPGGESK